MWWHATCDACGSLLRATQCSVLQLHAAGAAMQAAGPIKVTLLPQPGGPALSQVLMQLQPPGGNGPAQLLGPLSYDGQHGLHQVQPVQTASADGEHGNAAGVDAAPTPAHGFRASHTRSAPTRAAAHVHHAAGHPQGVRNWSTVLRAS